MTPAPPEDEIAFARRRAQEGVRTRQLVAELIARGAKPALARSLANAAIAALPGGGSASRIGWLQVVAGVLLLIAGVGLFYVRATHPFHGVSIGLIPPVAALLGGGVLLARGLFR